MLTLNNSITNLNNIADSHSLINHFFYGELYDFAASGVVNYPAMMVTQEPLSLSRGVITMSFNVYVADLVQKGIADRREVLSNTVNIALDILALLDREQEYKWSVNIDNITLNDFVDKFQDEVTGVWFKLDLRVPNALNRCAVPIAIPLVIKGEAPTGSGTTPWYIAGAYVQEITVEEGDLTYTIPCGDIGAYDALIDYGDNNVESVTSFNDSNLSHTYGKAGTYLVQITGSLPHIKFNNSGDKDKIIDIKQFGDIEILSWELSYYGCSNLVMSATDTPNSSNVTNMNSMMRDCNVIQPNTRNWNVSNVTNMQSFVRSSPLADLDVEIWNTSNLSLVTAAWFGATNSNPNLGSWNMGNISSFVDTFKLMGMSTDNYDLLLNNASGQTVQSGVQLDANLINYTTSVAGAAHTDLVTNDLWTINDAGGI